MKQRKHETSDSSANVGTRKKTCVTVINHPVCFLPIWKHWFRVPSQSSAAHTEKDAGELEQRDTEQRALQMRTDSVTGAMKPGEHHCLADYIYCNRGFADLLKHTPCSRSHKLLPISVCSPSSKTFQINESEAKVTQSLLGCLPSKQSCQEWRAALAGVKSASEEQWS